MPKRWKRALELERKPYELWTRWPCHLYGGCQRALFQMRSQRLVFKKLSRQTSILRCSLATAAARDCQWFLSTSTCTCRKWWRWGHPTGQLLLLNIFFSWSSSPKQQKMLSKQTDFSTTKSQTSRKIPYHFYYRHWFSSKLNFMEECSFIYTSSFTCRYTLDKPQCSTLSLGKDIFVWP